MRIYLSGSVTEAGAFQIYNSVETRLRFEGNYDIINTETVLQGLQLNSGERKYIRSALLSISDVLLLLPGWRNSPEACLDLGLALARKIKVYELSPNLRIKEIKP